MLLKRCKRLFVKLRSDHTGGGFNVLWTKLKLCTGNPEKLKLYKHETERVKQVCGGMKGSPGQFTCKMLSINARRS